MRPLSVFALIFCLVYPATPQIQHGSVGVVYFNHEKIIVAADSREIPSVVNAPPTDDGCKISAVNNDVVFVSTNMTRFLGGPRVAAWDNDSLIRAAYSNVKSSRGNIHERIGDVASYWAVMVAARFNNLAKVEPAVFKKILSEIGTGAFTVAYMGARDASGNLVLYMMSVSPNRFGSGAKPSAGPISSCSHQGFCAIGVIDTTIEFADQLTVRAKNEAATWKPPNGTPKRDYDILKTMRMVELTIKDHPNNDVGGPIDAVTLGRDGLMRWHTRKPNCPEK